MQRRELMALAFALAAGPAVPALAQTQALPKLIEASKPGVVLVGTHSLTDSPRFGFRGTGFVVEQGRFVVTNAHVLPPPDALDSERRVVIQAWQGGSRWEQREVRTVALARAHDLVLLQVEGAPLPGSLKLAPEALVREGTEIALMGFPVGGVLGFSHVTHRGIVASVTGIALPQPSAQALNERAIRQIREGSFDIYQLDAVAYPGNSGGPLFDVANGTVIGVINMVLTKSREAALSSPTGISYALPVRHVHALLRQAQLP
ncbi:S1 family peptidase [Inhella proteolytica]|uniref:Trypsin-like peptidase domain-containing protein n=1 Tax=Inhella proteolytica TaxID=2795029 RepID=A0A931J079_9BURK|nr:serine protease [Inhella proteolytica]MBH9576308.1 trypsin-like peptidase domain-containing protein [Inhella proteolytica]